MNTEPKNSTAPDLSNTVLADALSIDNKLIAKFMGYCEDGIYCTNGSHKLWEGGFLYHSSWDWLMPVVEKIESLKFNKVICIYFKIHKNYVSIDCFDKYSNCIYSHELPYSVDSKIESVFKGVVKFINWYNMQDVKF